MTALRAIRLGLWALVAVAAAGAGFLFLQRPGGTGFGNGVIAEATALGGPFRLTAQDGREVTEADLKGHPSLMFFGYTFCPDVCPTALGDATTWLRQLGPDADRLKVYFVSVDPERDTREKMAEYLTAFDPRIVGLTGSPEAVEQIVKGYGVFVRRVPQPDGQPYLVDHSASFYILGQDGLFSGAIRADDTPEEAFAKVRRALEAA